MVLQGPLIHHFEVSKQGFVLADLPFKTIWGINTVHSYFTIQNHNSEWFQMVHQIFIIIIIIIIVSVCGNTMCYLNYREAEVQVLKRT